MKLGELVAKLDQYRVRFGDHLNVRMGDDDSDWGATPIGEVALKHEMGGRGDPYIVLEGTCDED